MWQLGDIDENAVDKVLPIDATVAAASKQPWVLHVLTVNTLNFCSFAMCLDGMPQVDSMGLTIESPHAPKPVLIAVPNTVNSGGV